MNDRLTVVWSRLIAEFVPWRYIIARRATAGGWVIVLNKLIERGGFAGILLDAFHYGLATDGAEVRDIIVHTAIKLRSEHATRVHKSAFVYIYHRAILIVKDKVRPRHFVHLTSKRQVLVPTIGFCGIELFFVRTAKTFAT